MLKVMTIVGTRPEIIKLSRVIAKLDQYTNHILVHTGQNFDYELNEIFFEEMSIRKPQHFLNSAGNTAIETIANILTKTDALLEEEQPDALLLYGDTNSCLSAIAAKRRKIPIFHMEAGNRCFDQRVPEEINRKIVDHLSDINMPISEHARRYLLDEGVRGETIIKVGSSMKEVLDYHKQAIDASKILDSLSLKPQDYFVISAHREENIESDHAFTEFLNTLQAIADKYKKRMIVSTHPRTMKKLKTSKTFPNLKTSNSNIASADTDATDINTTNMNITNINTSNIDIEWLKPLGFFDYIQLQRNAFCVISDSGTITEEASLLSCPAITIRNVHERPEGMDSGVLILSGLKPEHVLDSIDIAVSIGSSHGSPMNERCQHSVADYNVDNLSDKVVKIIMSYTPYIKRTVWKEGE